jgi:hypothetical protein
MALPYIATYIIFMMNFGPNEEGLLTSIYMALKNYSRNKNVFWMIIIFLTDFEV